MGKPYLVKHGHLVARIVYAPSDGLYHAYFNVGGKRVTKAAKTLELAEARIRKTMKLACQGQVNIAAMTGSNLERLNTAVAVLGAGISAVVGLLMGGTQGLLMGLLGGLVVFGLGSGVVLMVMRMFKKGE